MNDPLHWPLPVRLALLFVVGCFSGGAVNWAIYTFAINRRAISPWSRPPEGAAGRGLLDRLPICGWLRLRRETPLHGAGFWRRPLAIEILTGLLLAGLYYWEVERLGLLPEALTLTLANLGNGALRHEAFIAAHWQFLAHALLALFGMAAAVVDLDEKTIPDLITVPGTLVGVVLLTLAPLAALPTMTWSSTPGGLSPQLGLLTIASPNLWPWTRELQGIADPRSLAVAIGCWLIWCLGLMTRVWRTRRGYRVAMRLFAHRLNQDPFTKWLLLLAVLGSAGIVATWRYALGPHWQSLVSSLVGLAAGGGMIWVVRNIGRLALGREAMGFGDVTLMSMFGVYLGWQACLFIFFLGSMAAAVIGGIEFLLRRDPEIRFGPFLYLAALMTIFDWAAIWTIGSRYMEIGWLVPAVLGGAALAIAPLLLLVRAIGNVIAALTTRPK